MTLGTVRLTTRHDIVRLDSLTRKGVQITAHLNRTLAQRVREAKEARWVEEAACCSSH